ncbi:MAG TPA: SCO family protein [Anaerolineales bacterium]|nr:SCO family protein [Anaerolineales bacterium]
MNKRVILIGISLLAFAALIALVLSLTKEYQFEGVLIDPAQPAPPLDLIDSKGRDFNLEDYRGEVVLLFFGYTSCPDVCPSTLSDMKQVVAALGEAADDVQVVFVTVDPQRDTFKKLNSYLSLFNPTFLGLSGTEEDLEPAWNGYGVFREIDTESETAAGYLVNHSSRLYLIDPSGDLALTYSFGTPPEDIAKDIKHILDS